MKKYSNLFSNSGPIKVIVKLTGFDGKISNQRMHAEEFMALLNEEHAGRFATSMLFDERQFEITKYEINPIQNKLVISAKRILNKYQ